MTAKDILTLPNPEAVHPAATVSADTPVFEALHLLLDTPTHELGVTDEDSFLGIINETSLLAGLARMIAPRDDCSVITLECSPEEYSASVISHAVEDSDAHLVDLLTTPGEEGRIVVTLRVRHSDPSSAIRNLERYGFTVTDAHASGQITEYGITAERLLSLQTLMNV